MIFSHPSHFSSVWCCYSHLCNKNVIQSFEQFLSKFLQNVYRDCSCKTVNIILKCTLSCRIIGLQGKNWQQLSPNCQKIIIWRSNGLMLSTLTLIIYSAYKIPFHFSNLWVARTFLFLSMFFFWFIAHRITIENLQIYFKIFNHIAIEHYDYKFESMGMSSCETGTFTNNAKEIVSVCWVDNDRILPISLGVPMHVT